MIFRVLPLLLMLLPGRSLWAEGPGPVPIEGRLNLTESVHFALTHHPALEAAQSEWLAAQARVSESEAAFWPKLGAGLYANAGNTAMIVTGAPTAEPAFWSALPAGGLSANLSLMLPLYTGGRLQARLGQARAEERAQLARTALTLREVARDARKAYYDALQAHSRLDTAGWKVVQQDELLRLTRHRVEVGSLALYVQRRVEAEVAAARQELNTAAAEESNAIVSLSVALGGAPDSHYQLAPPPPAQTPLQTPQQDVQLGLQDRPDLIVARHLIESSDQRLQQTLAAYSPQLAAYAMAEAMRQPALGPRPFEGGYQVGMVLSWPIFDGERDARSQEAEAMLSARQQEVRRLEQVVAGEVLRSRTRLEAAISNEILAATEVKAAEEELRIAKLRYQLGRGLYLEVLDAITVRLRAWQNVTSSLRERGAAEADFFYAVGRLE